MGDFFRTSLGLWAFLSGAFLCCVYDVLRVFRLRTKPNALVLFLCDFAFCLFATLVMLILFFNFSFGRVRVYAFFFVLLGFLLWRFTLGRLLVGAFGKLLDYFFRLVVKFKACCKRALKSLIRIIKTKIYCRKTVKKSKIGFGIKTERN